MRRLVILLATLSLPVLAAAEPARVQVVAARLTSPVTVDGVLDEPIWRQAPAFTAFVQGNPVEGGTPSQRTEVRVAYDEDALYIGARMWDEHPDSILARLTRRDVDIAADLFSVYLDPYQDRRSGYYFIVNAAGVLYDGALSNDVRSDASWDGVWSGVARIDDRGWTCEMRIPFSQMRFNRGDHHVWGIDFRRLIGRHNEEDWLAYPPRKESGFVSRFGDLTGLADLPTRSAIELLPYVTNKGEFLRHDPGDPFHGTPRYTPAGGGDLRMGLGQSLTLNATVNPDFGQVEVDPAVVNLSDVESYFEEKRPFFVEGMHNFRFGNEGANDYWTFNWPEPTFFYSRRIGRAPQGVADGVDFSDVPVATSILGATKVTGKLTPTVDFGTMHALTGRETASYQLGDRRWDAEAEPLTYYGAARGMKEFKDRRAGFGLMSTVVARHFDGSGLDADLNRLSLMGGFDGWLAFGPKQKYVLSGYTTLSHVEGTRARLLALQESGTHYLQRPDRQGFRLDSSATAMTGVGTHYWLNKQSGNVLLNCGVGYLDPRFDVNDIGFMSYADVLNAHFGTGYQWDKTNAWHKYANVLLAAFSSWTADRDRTVSGLWASENVNWVNNWELESSADHVFRGIDARRARGGPLMVMRPLEEYTVHFESDAKRPVWKELDANLTHSASGSYDWSANPYVEWKPRSNITLGLGPGMERVLEHAQWITEVADPAASATYGQRVVFATLEQRSYFASLRVNWAFSPTVSLQLYAQPLISSGRYADFKELARPRSYDFTRYGSVTRDGGRITVTPASGAPFSFDDPDFDIKSLRGNAVFRWEYRPGSTFFLVWTQQREDNRLLDAFQVRRAFDRLLDVSGDNIFLAKVTYYFAI